MPRYILPVAPAGAASPTRLASPQSLARRRKLAEAMLEQAGSTAPIGHWTQGLARAAQGGLGGLMAARADAEEKAAREQAGASLKAALAKAQGISPELAAAASNPHLGTAQQSLAQAMFKRALGPEADPGLELRSRGMRQRQLAEMALRQQQPELKPVAERTALVGPQSGGVVHRSPPAAAASSSRSRGMDAKHQELLLHQANDAVAKGADRQAVTQRLRELGVEVEGGRDGER